MKWVSLEAAVDDAFKAYIHLIYAIGELQPKFYSKRWTTASFNQFYTYLGSCYLIQKHSAELFQLENNILPELTLP